jgi:hypothetical protein
MDKQNTIQIPMRHAVDQTEDKYRRYEIEKFYIRP